MLRISSLLALLAALVVVSCGEEEEASLSMTITSSPSVVATSPSALTKVPAESIADPEIVPVDESACVSRVCLIVNSLVFHPFKPESDGLDGVVFDVTIENQSSLGDVQYDVSEFLAVDAAGFAYQPQPGAGSPPLSVGTVPLGLKSQGQILFEFEEGAEPVELRWDGQAAEIIVPVARN